MPLFTCCFAVICSGKFLTELDDEAVAAIQARISSNPVGVTLATDGTTLLGDRALVGHSVIHGGARTRGEAVQDDVWSVSFPGTTRQIAVNVADDIMDVISEIGPLNVVGVAADNCSTMKKAVLCVKEKYVCC